MLPLNFGCPSNPGLTSPVPVRPLLLSLWLEGNPVDEREQIISCAAGRNQEQHRLLTTNSAGQFTSKTSHFDGKIGTLAPLCAFGGTLLNPAWMVATRGCERGNQWCAAAAQSLFGCLMGTHFNRSLTHPFLLKQLSRCTTIVSVHESTLKWMLNARKTRHLCLVFREAEKRAFTLDWTKLTAPFIAVKLSQLRH